MAVDEKMPLHYACKGGQKDVVQYLVEDAKCDVNVKAVDGKRPLHYACKRRRKDVVQYLVEDAKCDVNIVAVDGKMPLHYACKRGQKDVVQYLVEDAKCDVNVKAVDGKMPLHYACKGGQKDVVQYLVDDAKCDINIVAVDGKMPLHYACKRGQKDVVQYLVEDAKCDVNVKAVDGKMPLHYACKVGGKDVVQYLVEDVKCDVDVVDHMGITPLQLSCDGDHKKVIKYLVEDAKCDISEINWKNKTPLGMAETIGSIGNTVVDYSQSLKGTAMSHAVNTAHPGDKVDLAVDVVLQAPSTTYQWFLEEQPISVDNSDYEGSQTSTLVVRECLSKHRGIYKCLITSEANGTTVPHYTKLELDGTRIGPGEAKLLGRILQTIEPSKLANSGIYTEHLISGTSDLLLEELQFLIRRIPGYRQFANNLTKEYLKTTISRAVNTAHPGDKVDLAVDVVLQAPSTTYQWFLEEQPISVDNSDYEGSQTSTLVIRECLSKHRGNYKCLITSEANVTTFPHYTKLELDGTRIGPGEAQLLCRILQTIEPSKLAKSGIYTEHLVSGTIDLLLEELQFLIRKIPGYLQFANNLTKKNLETRVREEQLFQEAMKDDVKLCLLYLKMIALGPAQVGKSTFLRRLLGIMKWDIDSAPGETQPHCSTGQAEMVKVHVEENLGSSATDGSAPLKDYTSQSVIVSHTTWHTFEGETELEEELATFNSMIMDAYATKSTKHHAQPPHMKEQKNSKHAEVKCKIEKSDSTQTSDMPSSKSVSVKSDSTFEDTVVSKAVKKPSKFRRERRELDKSKRYKSITDFENLRQKALTNPEFSPKLVRIIINTGDVGGQPAFLEMLPALTIGPAMYMILLHLLQGLKTTYPVMFKCEGDDEARSCQGYTYNSEEVIFKALSSIACFALPDEDLEGFICKDGESQKQESVALLCGTFADKVVGEANRAKVNTMEKQLREQLEGSSFFKEGLVEYAERDNDPEKCRVLFQINNKAGGEEEVMRYRKILEELIKKKFRKFELPARWFILNMFLKSNAKKGDRATVSIEECLEIGRELKMDKEMVKMALRFLHKYIGLVMFFPEIDDSYLQQHVICSPQVVFSSITELIFKVYTPKNLDISLPKHRHFVQTGQFSTKDIKVKSKDHLLPVDSLVKLLVHLNIAAPIILSQDDPSQDDPRYILPAVLQTARDEDLLPSNLYVQNEEVPESLLVQFNTGFLPLGIFCAVIANLVAANDLKLMDGSHHNYTVHRNKVTFRALGKYDVTLISWPKYIEIRVSHVPGVTSIEDLGKCCPYIRQTVCKALDRVIIRMRKNALFKPSRDYSLGFRCNLKHPTDHVGHETLMLIDSKEYDPISEIVPKEMTCSTCVTSTELSAKMKVWYRKPTPPNISSQPASVLEVGEGKDTSLGVTAEGSTPLTYEWTKDGKKLQDGIHYDGSSTDYLQMKQAHVKLRGKYCCIVSNRVGKVSSSATDLTIVDLKFSREFDCEALAVWLKQNKISGVELQLFRDQKIDGNTFLTLPTDTNELVNELGSPKLPLGAKRQLVLLITEACKVSGNTDLEEVPQTGFPARIVIPEQRHQHGPPSDGIRSKEFRESFSPDEVSDFLRQIGLRDKDITLLVDEGFGTAPGFKTLTCEELKEIKISRAGQNLLKHHLVATETLPTSTDASGKSGGTTPPCTASSSTGVTSISMYANKEFEELSNEEIIELVDNDTILNEDDLADVSHFLTEVSANWQTICTKLHVKTNTIEGLANSNKSDGVRLNDALTDWLRLNYNHQKCGKPTWKNVAGSVEGINNGLFLKIASQHKKKKEQDVYGETLFSQTIHHCSESSQSGLVSLFDGNIQISKATQRKRRSSSVKEHDLNDNISDKPSQTTAQSTPDSLVAWFKKIGLCHKDIELLNREGFTTKQAFLTLTKDDIPSLKLTIEGVRILNSHVTQEVGDDTKQATSIASSHLHPDTHLRYLYEHTIAACTKWYNIGLQLALPVHTLDTIGRNVRLYDDKEYYREMLTSWMNSGSTKCSELLDVLEGPTVAMKDVADSVRSLDDNEKRLIGL